MQYQRTQTGADLWKVLVQLPGPDGGGKLNLVGDAKLGERRMGGRVAHVEQLALDDTQRVGGHPGVEVDLPAGGFPDIGFQELGDRGDQLGGGRPAMDAAVHETPSSSRS